jgi:hypothetical protein
MITQIQPLSEINIRAFQVLAKEIGLEKTVRFLNQFTTGHGNYTEERRKFFSDLQVSDIVKDIKKTKKI